ncbi:MAG: mechanosensitive ion channel family protein, partial [Candidatus Omnitrophica bacterium]|nr:mechanosensitive ion channel family protein [Candidatus Omnitrophota bacterium]
RYIAAAIVLAAGLFGVRLFARRFLQRLKMMSRKTASTLDDFLVDMIETGGLPLLSMAAAYIALKMLVFPEFMQHLLNQAMLGLVVFFAVRAAIATIGYAFKIYLIKRGSDAALEKSLSGIMIVVKMVVWGSAIIFFLDNLGLKISAVIAGLGIGGVAVALAAQTLLKDLFSYFCILFDHPFKVGDFIIVGDFMGTIEYIGIKTTRIRSLGGEMLVFSNSDLTDSRLRNYKLMEKRRVVFRINVAYQTPPETVKEIPGLLKKIVADIPGTVFDRAHFFAFGDFSLIFEIVYYVAGADYTTYMDIQQRINLGILEAFQRRDIRFAYPTQTIYVAAGRDGQALPDAAARSE